MTRKELEKIYPLRKEVEMWRGELAEPDEVTKNKEVQKIIKRMYDKRQKELSECLSFINSIEDSYIKRIVVARCVESKSWVQISFMIGGENSADSIRMQFNRAFPK